MFQSHALSGSQTVPNKYDTSLHCVTCLGKRAGKHSGRETHYLAFDTSCCVHTKLITLTILKKELIERAELFIKGKSANFVIPYVSVF